MATIRCYVPLSAQQVEDLRTTRHLDGPLDAHAVTPALQQAHPSGELEEWEYAALQEAAAAQAAHGRPVIVAAVDLVHEKVDQTRVEGGEPGQVRLTDLDLPRVAALHLGDDVVTGRAQSAMRADEPLELSWYDTTEIGHVAELAQAVDPTR